MVFILCIGHFGNPVLGETGLWTGDLARPAFLELDRPDPGTRLLLLPSLARVGGNPGFGSRRQKFAVLRVGEFDAGDISRED